ncbi:ELOA [Balamuthia mandrillaris]
MMMQKSLPLTDFEKQLLQEIKAFRANPTSYAAILEQTRKPHYSGNVLTVDRVRMRTEEGVAACDEAIAYLKGLRGALPELELEYGLVIAAKESCKENGSQGAFDTNAVEKLSHLGALDGGSRLLSFSHSLSSRPVVPFPLLCFSASLILSSLILVLVLSFYLLSSLILLFLLFLLFIFFLLLLFFFFFSLLLSSSLSRLSSLFCLCFSHSFWLSLFCATKVR